MTTSQVKPIIHWLRRTTAARYGPGMTDGEIFEAFLASHDEAAFEALLRRHGPMVLGVCLRILRDHHAAEDAFQATFLVFARKASSVRPRARIAGWLHGVALRTALKARTMKARTRVREKQVPQMPEPQATPNDNWDDLRPVLDEELARLSEIYRLPILLCDLEEKSIKEAARQLGWPQGTVAGRLARARKMLAKRLTQRGVVLSTGALAALLAAESASANLAPALAGSTVKAAVALAAGKSTATLAIAANVVSLTEGVLQAMLMSKFKTVLALVLILGVFAFGGSWLSRPTAIGQEFQADCAGDKPANRPAAPRATGTALPKTALPREDGKARVVTYPVADLVVPITGLDDSSPPGRPGQTKEAWLIDKIVRTIAPASWKNGGGSGTIQFYPLGLSLVVTNTPRVQAQVRYLLETMRRVQEVEVTSETRILVLNAACFAKLQDRLPELKPDAAVVLDDAATAVLLRHAQDDATAKVVQEPKITLIPGQRVGIEVNAIKDVPGIKRIAVQLNALVAGNLQHIELDVNATVGTAKFARSSRLVDGSTLAQVQRYGGDYLLLLVTPRVILDTGDDNAN